MRTYPKLHKYDRMYVYDQLYMGSTKQEDPHSTSMHSTAGLARQLAAAQGPGRVQTRPPHLQSVQTTTLCTASVFSSAVRRVPDSAGALRGPALGAAALAASPAGHRVGLQGWRVIS